MQINLTGNETINDTIQIINNLTTQGTWLENKIQAQHTTLRILGFLLIITTILFLLYIKRNGQIKKNVQKQEEIYLEILKTAYDLEHNEKIKEVNISDLPHNLREDLLKRKSFISQIFFKGDKKEGHKEPFLLLIRSNMTGEIKHNAKEGEYIIEKKDTNKTKVRFILTRNKLIDVKIKGKYYRFWVQFEDEAEPYPLQPQHHASQFYNIVLALQMAKQGIGPKKGKFPKILIIIGIIAIIGGIAWYAWSKAHGGTTPPVETIIQVANNTINATINSTTGIQAQTIQV